MMLHLKTAWSYKLLTESQDSKKQSSAWSYKLCAMKGTEVHSMAFSEEEKIRGLNPSVAVALALIQVGEKYKTAKMETKDGETFTFLPLNIKSETNFHINAGFALPANRRDLWQDDGMSNSDIRGRWNNYLLCEEIPKAFINALEEVKDLQVNGRVEKAPFDFLWPNYKSDTSKFH